MIKDIELKIDNHFKHLNDWEHINKWLSKTNAVLFGGAIRSIYFNQIPKDYDIVISPNTNCSYLELFPHKKNSFGGYKIKINNIYLDIWDLNITWAFREKYFKPSFANLLNTTFFNIESITYNLNNKNICNDGFIKSVKTNTLEINFKHNPHVELCLLRIMKFNLQGFNIGNSILEYIKEYYNDCKIQKIFEWQEKHYRKIFFNQEAIKLYFNEIIK